MALRCVIPHIDDFYTIDRLASLFRLCFSRVDMRLIYSTFLLHDLYSFSITFILSLSPHSLLNLSHTHHCYHNACLCIFWRRWRDIYDLSESLLYLSEHDDGVRWEIWEISTGDKGENERSKFLVWKFASANGNLKIAWLNSVWKAK